MKYKNPILNFAHKIQTDPAWQFRFNGSFVIVWAIAMVGVLFLPTFWGVANLPALLIMEVSLWANFATHFGAMSAGLAAMNTADDMVCEVPLPDGKEVSISIIDV